MVWTCVEEEVEGVLVGEVHGEVSGREVGGGECVPRGARFQEDFDDGGVTRTCGVHERSEALFIEVRDVGAAFD